MASTTLSSSGPHPDKQTFPRDESNHSCVISKFDHTVDGVGWTALTLHVSRERGLAISVQDISAQCGEQRLWHHQWTHFPNRQTDVIRRSRGKVAFISGVEPVSWGIVSDKLKATV